MLAIILTAVGWTAASTGLMLWAIGEIVIGNHDLMYDSGLILMIGGTIVGIIGSFMYKAAEDRTARERAAKTVSS
jgi:hypothetical protein